jgi:rhodanese-related sulfurtransferase
MVTEIQLDETQKLIHQGAQVIEVLPPVEFEEEHLPGAINFRLKTSMKRPPASSIEIGQSSLTAGTTSET